LNKLIDYNKLNKKIIFTGLLRGYKKNKLLAESYFLILPSHTENFGNVVLEALICGTPVIASFGTPWKILEEKKAGFYCENSIKVLSNTILNTLELTDLEYTKMCRNAQSLFDEQFSIEKNIHAWEKIYQTTN
jgi:glycosyltransferase involved in cell wall biosynthesis